MATFDFTKMSIKKITLIVFGVIALAFLLISTPVIIEDVDANEICVIQAPISGTLRVVKSAGTYWQGWGKVTKYPKSFQYWFSSKKDEGNGNGDVDESIKIRFNDKAHAQLSGSIRIDMPLDDSSVIKLHTKYGSQLAIEHALVGQLITKSVYMAGTLMSSSESNAERRNELLQDVEDQAINGVYKTHTATLKVKDPMDETQENTVTAVLISTDVNGQIQRIEASPAKEFNLRLYNLTLNEIKYTDDVEKQIQEQQKAIMAVQTAKATSKKAEQDAYTAAKSGEAAAAKAEWAQKTLNATIIAEAEGRKLTATQDALAAEQEKKASILRGDGEAYYKKAVTQANNNIELKLEAWNKERAAAWDAFAKFQGNLVPQYISGGAGGGTNAMTWMEAMGMNAMKSLNLEALGSGNGSGTTPTPTGKKK